MPEAPSPFIPLEGGCACKKLRYRVEASPLVVHCCHCTTCQLETGTAFALNYVVEAEQVVITEGEKDMLLIDMPTDSGRPQTMYAVVSWPGCFEL